MQIDSWVKRFEKMLVSLRKHRNAFTLHSKFIDEDYILSQLPCHLTLMQQNAEKLSIIIPAKLLSQTTNLTQKASKFEYGWKA